VRSEEGSPRHKVMKKKRSRREEVGDTILCWFKAAALEQREAEPRVSCQEFVVHSCDMPMADTRRKHFTSQCIFNYHWAISYNAMRQTPGFKVRPVVSQVVPNAAWWVLCCLYLEMIGRSDETICTLSLQGSFYTECLEMARTEQEYSLTEGRAKKP